MDYRQQLTEFTGKIHNTFGLQEQGKQLITLLRKGMDCQHACLLFSSGDGKDFNTLFCHPKSKTNPFSNVTLSGNSPFADYLVKEKTLLSKEKFTSSPELAGLWENSSDGVSLDEVKVILPLISRNKLIGIFLLGKKESGEYSADDFSLLENTSEQVAAAMEKECLIDQLRHREEELLVLNRAYSLIMSSLDIQKVFDGFIGEMNKLIEINWAAVTLIEDEDLYFLALTSKIKLGWKVGDRFPFSGTAAEWVIDERKSRYEPDLNKGSQFTMSDAFSKNKIRSVVHLPLIVNENAIGSFIVGNHNPNAYDQADLLLLDHLAPQIAMPVDNSRLFAEVEERTRIDGMTNLLNRRSLDEVMASEINRHSRYGGVFSLIILDLDIFKDFNDTYGHLAGDKLLGKVGVALKKSIRNSDHAFRYGGDEFAIVLPNTPVEDAQTVAERVRFELSKELIPGFFAVTASLGIGCWPTNGRQADEVIVAADEASYRAKRAGGNQLQFATGLK